MFDATSRYATIAQKTYRGSVQYVGRRTIPTLANTTTFVRHNVVQGDRLDTISARYLGDATQFWRICDSSVVLSPTDLVREPGKTIKISGPQQ